MKTGRAPRKLTAGMPSSKGSVVQTRGACPSLACDAVSSLVPSRRHCTEPWKARVPQEEGAAKVQAQRPRVPGRTEGGRGKA